MQARFDFGKASPGAARAMAGLGQYLHGGAMEQPLLNLVLLRASQINGCAYCIDSHWRELRDHGESEQRLYGLDAWRESPYYSERERAALEWTEALTLITHGHVPDSVYESVRAHFSETALADLTLAVATINAWNRISIASRALPEGSERQEEQKKAS
jgi:AhpD family alkylhydroperoxidase